MLAGDFLERAGTQEQKQEWIPKLIAGQSHIALAHVETQARFLLDHVETRYQANGEAAYLSGKKTFVIGAAAADAFILSAISHTDSASHSDNISFFLVDKNAPGLTIRKYRLIDGSIACQLTLKNVPSNPMQGTFQDLLFSIAKTKIGACAEMLGLMECLYEATLEHVKTREQFGRQLSKFQVISHRIAEAYASLELCRSHVMRLATLNETDSDYMRIISGVKAFMSKAAISMGEEAIQLHGGMGITDELIVGHAFKRILLLSTLFGDEDTELKRYIQS